MILQPVQIVLTGLDEKSDVKLRVPGKLDEALNVEADKQGALNKRRGYRRVVLDEIHGDGLESVFCNVAPFRGELLLYGSEYLYSVVGITTEITQGTIASRGPVLRGNCGVRHITSSSISEEQVS